MTFYALVFHDNSKFLPLLRLLADLSASSFGFLLSTEDRSPFLCPLPFQTLYWARESSPSSCSVLSLQNSLTHSYPASPVRTKVVLELGNTLLIPFPCHLSSKFSCWIFKLVRDGECLKSSTTVLCTQAPNIC